MPIGMLGPALLRGDAEWGLRRCFFSSQSSGLPTFSPISRRAIGGPLLWRSQPEQDLVGRDRRLAGGLPQAPWSLCERGGRPVGGEFWFGAFDPCPGR